MNDSAIRDAFKQVREKGKERVKEKRQELSSDLKELSLDEVIRGLSDACDEYEPELLISISHSQLKINPMRFKVRIPDPAFFFIEHGSPFILGLLGEELRGKGEVNQYENYLYQIRTCCASIREPKLSIDDLKLLPPAVIFTLFDEITEAIAPPNAVALMQCFYRKTKDEKTRDHLLEVYLMCQANYRSTSSYLVPSVKNPFMVDAVEKIMFEIGHEYESEMQRIQFSLMSMTPLKKLR